MIIAWIIGLLLSLLGIWVFKNSRKITWRNGEIIDREPVLKVWSLLLLLLPAIVPLVNIFEFIIMIVWWYLSVYNVHDWEFVKKDNKLIQFLNKPIQ